MRLQEIYDQYKSRADFYFVYIREAHPADGLNPSRHVRIDQPTTHARRNEVASQCCADLKLTIPVLVDDMNDTASKAFNAWPDRLFIIGADGRIAYRGDRGPRGFKADEMEASLKELVREPKRARRRPR